MAISRVAVAKDHPGVGKQVRDEANMENIVRHFIDNPPRPRHAAGKLGEILCRRLRQRQRRPA